MKQNLAKFLFGIFLAPAVILLHECGHYLAAEAVGISAQLHFAETTVQQPRSTPPSVTRMIIAAGPAAEATLGSGGILLLWRLRRNRLQSPATLIDWLATFSALCAGRWLRCLTGTPAHPQPLDEAHLSASLGFPPWLLAYLLAPISLAIFVVAIRQHPRGSRLVPFTSAILGLALGAILWTKILGPKILP